MDESGYRGFKAATWFGLFAPAGTAATIVHTRYLQTVKVLGQADARAKLAELGFEVIGNAPNELDAAIKLEIPKWAKVIKESNIKAD